MDTLVLVPIPALIHSASLMGKYGVCFSVIYDLVSDVAAPVGPERGGGSTILQCAAKRGYTSLRCDKPQLDFV